MAPKVPSLILTESQAACLIALRSGKLSKPRIAIEAKVSVSKADTTLHRLAQLGLAKQDRSKKWHTTTRGKTCSFRTALDRRGPHSAVPGSGGQRLLTVLNRPMRGREIAEILGVSHQRIRQLVTKLYAQGLVTFGDLEKPFWSIRPAGERTTLLSHDEERVLSAIPMEYVTDVRKIRLAARMPEKHAQEIVERLVARRLVEALEGVRSTRVYRLTEAGKNHPQRDQSARSAATPRLPVESERVRKVLSTILDHRALRIKDVTDLLRIPRASTNALIQYLKRKDLIKKTGPEYEAPYSLTDKGRVALSEMTRRLAA